MTSIGSFDAKTNLPKLLERVEKGETIQITRRGVPIAKLVPVSTGKKRDKKEIVRQIQQLRQDITTGGLSVRDMMREGRA